jgi:hypothetical protein
MTELPKNWDTLSLDALWNNLNDPQRYPTPQSTIEAVMYSIRERGLAALKEPANEERLSRCDEPAKKQIDERIKKMREKGIIK